jgi:glycosyltransferase involved in cell wall biosynthesis
MHFTANVGWSGRGPVASVVTVHDLVFMKDRGRGARQRLGRAYLSRKVRASTQAADALVAGTEHSRQALVATGWVDARAVEVIPHGVPFPPDVARLSERRPWFVVFAGRDPRKNAATGIRAFTQARPRLGPDARLYVLAGAGLGPGDREAIAAAGDAAEVWGYRPRADLDRLLASARAVIHPTTDEGFGLPALEAMARGAVVLGGLAPAAAEVSGDALVRVDPADRDGSLAGLLAELGTDPAKFESAAAAGRARAAQHGWPDVAGRYLRVYAAALSAFAGARSR